MPLSSIEIELLNEELKKNHGRAVKAAYALGLSYWDVAEYVASTKPKTFSANPRPELEKYIVVSKPVTALWPRCDAVERARARYDAGLVELVQWRDGNTLHLLAIPRRKRAFRRVPYFRELEEV